MPLYKLTEKRMNKKAREDEDGITEIKAKMREMGEDVDGSESEGWSESDSDEDDDDEDEDDDKDEEDVSEDEGSEDEDGDLDVDVEGLESDSDDIGEDGEEGEDMDDASSSSSIFPISLESALTEPIYRSPVNPSEQLCVLCPDKALKSDQMIKIHLESQGHKRSSKRYAKRLTTNPPKEGTDPREVVDEILADMDAGEMDDKRQADSENRVTGTTKDATTKGEDEVSKKRKRNKDERKTEKAQKLLDAQTTTIAKGSQEGEKKAESEEGGKTGGQLNRKARRLLALQNGDIKQTQKAKQNEK